MKASSPPRAGEQREGVGGEVCRGLATAAIFKHVQSLLGQDRGPESFHVGGPGSSLRNSHRYRRRRPLIPPRGGLVFSMSVVPYTDRGVKLELSDGNRC